MAEEVVTHRRTGKPATEKENPREIGIPTCVRFDMAYIRHGNRQETAVKI
jgi:hypothetical protein